MCGIVGFVGDRAASPICAGRSGSEKTCRQHDQSAPCSRYAASVVTAVALQLFAYYFAKARGCEIDRPRHLAKSVTVE